MSTNIQQALNNLNTLDYSVDHIRRGGKVVAIRRRSEGRYSLGFSDPAEKNIMTVLDVAEKDLEHVINTFLYGQLGDDPDYPRLFINQGWRECAVVKTTPTRARIEYEMPNAGLMGGWQKYVDLDVFVGPLGEQRHETRRYFTWCR